MPSELEPTTREERERWKHCGRQTLMYSSTQDVIFRLVADVERMTALARRLVEVARLLREVGSHAAYQELRAVEADYPGLFDEGRVGN